MSEQSRWTVGTAIGLGLLLIALFTNLSARIDDVGERIDRLDARMDRLDSRMDRLDSRMETLDSRLRAVEIAFGKVDQRLLTLERVVLPGPAG